MVSYADKKKKKKEFKNKSGTVASGWFSHFFLQPLSPMFVLTKTHSHKSITVTKAHGSSYVEHASSDRSFLSGPVTHCFDFTLWDILCCSQTLWAGTELTSTQTHLLRVQHVTCVLQKHACVHKVTIMLFCLTFSSYFSIEWIFFFQSKIKKLPR